MLKVPIGLADFEDAGSADQHRRRLHERVETAERGGDALDERRVPRHRPQIVADGEVRAALHLGDDGISLRLDEIDDGDARARAGESERRLLADAAGGAGEQNRLALEAGAEVERHVSSLPWR